MASNDIYNVLFDNQNLDFEKFLKKLDIVKNNPKINELKV